MKSIFDGKNGAAAFDFESAHDPLKAKKSWFFFDDEYVCLGASVQSSSPYPVATTINQTLLNSKVVANQSGVFSVLPRYGALPWYGSGKNACAPKQSILAFGG